MIGLGRFGSAVARALVEMGQDVIGIDSDPENVARLSDIMTHVIEADATDEKALRAAGIRDVDAAIVSIGENVEASLLIVMSVKELGIEKVIAKATTALHGRILEKIGVSRVIFPERDMGIRLAHSLIVPGVVDYIELSRDFSLVELPAPDEFIGKTLRQLELRARLALTLVAIRRSGPGEQETTRISPGPDEPIRAGDMLILLGSNERLANLEKVLKGKA